MKITKTKAEAVLERNSPQIIDKPLTPNPSHKEKPVGLSNNAKKTEGLAFSFVGPRPEHLSEREERDWLDRELLRHALGEFVSRTHDSFRDELILDGSLFLSPEEFAKRIGKDHFSEKKINALIDAGEVPCYETTDGKRLINVRRLASHLQMEVHLIALTLKSEMVGLYEALE